MSNFQTPVVMQSARSVLTQSSVKRRIDPIDAPARPLGSKRSALVVKRADSAALSAGHKTGLAAAGDSLLPTPRSRLTNYLGKRAQSSIRPICRVIVLIRRCLFLRLS